MEFTWGWLKELGRWLSTGAMEVLHMVCLSIFCSFPIWSEQKQNYLNSDWKSQFCFYRNRVLTRRNLSSPSFVGSFFSFLFKTGGQQVLVNSTWTDWEIPHGPFLWAGLVQQWHLEHLWKCCGALNHVSGPFWVTSSINLTSQSLDGCSWMGSGAAWILVLWGTSLGRKHLLHGIKETLLK